MEVSVETARFAAKSINAFMASWDSRLSAETLAFWKKYKSLPTPFAQCRVESLQQINATLEFERDGALWLASWQDIPDEEKISDMLFIVRQDGTVLFATGFTYLPDDLSELD